MRSLNEWRQLQESEQPAHVDLVKQHLQMGDWGWLKWVLGSSSPKTDSKLVSYLHSVVTQIMDEIAKDNKKKNALDLPIQVNQALALDLMAAALKVLAPEESGSGRRIQTGMLGKYFGDGEGDLANMRKLAGHTSIAVKGNIIQRLRSKVNTLKELYARKQTQPGQVPVDFDHLSPNIKEPFIIDILVAVLKAAFPGADASGGGKSTLSTRKLDQYITAPKTPVQSSPDEEEQSAPANWKG